MRLLHRIFHSQSLDSNGFEFVKLGYRILASSILLIVHGFPKVSDFQGTILDIPDPFHIGSFNTALIAIVGDFLCPICIALGFITKPAALFVISVTLTGLLIVHFNDPWETKEIPYLYSISFLLIFFMGPGKYSVDRLIQNKLES